MISDSTIIDIISKAYKEVLEKKIPSDLNIQFIGYDSNLESIDIVQIISMIEDLLENDGYSGYDLLERVLEFDELTFKDLIKLLKDDLTN